MAANINLIYMHISYIELSLFTFGERRLYFARVDCLNPFLTWSSSLEANMNKNDSTSTRSSSERYPMTLANHRYPTTRASVFFNSKMEGSTTYWKTKQKTGNSPEILTFHWLLQHSSGGIILASFDLGVSQHFGAPSPNAATPGLSQEGCVNV